MASHETRLTADFKHARELILAYGWNSTCYQILNPGFTRWFSAERDAVVGYVESYGTWVVGGAPVCAADRLGEVAAEFEQEAQDADKRVCYFGAEERLESLYADSRAHSSMLLGAQPVWDLHGWPQIISEHASLRAQLNRARNKGVAVSEWPSRRVKDHPALRRCLSEWLGTRGLPPLHFLVETDTLSRPLDRRWFVGESKAEVVGFVATSPVPKRKGYLVEQFVRGAGAVNGTTELMLDGAMRALMEQGSAYVTLGLAPLSMRGERTYRSNPTWLRLLLAWMRAHGRRFYNFKGVEAFKAKLRPHRWDPVHAISNRPRIRPSTLYAIAGAFAAGSPAALILRGLWRAARQEASELASRVHEGYGLH